MDTIQYSKYGCEWHGLTRRDERRIKLKIPRQDMPEQDQTLRVHNFQEVPYGYTTELALLEAGRSGHPYVDIWQAVKPSVIGVDRWPEVPRGQPWKEGVIAALGINATPAAFWKHVLGQVTSWKDLETPLLGAVEELIDFVAPPER